jgi:hypothetical protein
MLRQSRLRSALIACTFNRFPRTFLKDVPEETPRHEEEPHPTPPLQLLSPIHEPMGQHPEWPDARYRVNCYRHPELHTISSWQVDEEPKIQDVHSGNYSRPELQAGDAALMFHGHDGGL